MRKFTRGIAWLICIVMVLGMLPTFVFAEDGDATESLPNINFTNPADAAKYEIVGQTSAAAVSGEGLALVTTTSGIEPAGRNITQAPVDLVKVPVSGDWSATLKVQFDTNGARNGYYQFFGFFAAADDDLPASDLVGIRGGDGAMQDFIRKDGNLTADTDGLKSTPGFNTSGSDYYLRLVKSGTTYTSYRSNDGGETYVQMFVLEDTGIEAKSIVIDAYTGMTTGYKFTLKSLRFSEDTFDYSALEAAVAAAEAQNIRTVNYTDETAAAYTAAMAAAQVALNGADTQDDIDAAAAALTAAVAGLEKKPPLTEEAWRQVTGIEPGKYVIVANGQSALNSATVASSVTGHSYSNSTTTLGAAPVTVADGKITSPVTEDMIWTVAEAQDTTAAYDGNAQYYLYAQDGRQLLHTGARNNWAALIFGTMNPSQPRYATWSFIEREAAPGAFTMYSNGTATAQWPMAMVGTESYFELNSKQWTAINFQTDGSAITLYKLG